MVQRRRRGNVTGTTRVADGGGVAVDVGTLAFGRWGPPRDRERVGVGRSSAPSRSRSDGRVQDHGPVLTATAGSLRSSPPRGHDVSQPPILVTGATGTVGCEVVHHLRATGRRVRALTRRPDRADLPAGVGVVGGDLDDPGSLGPALDGVDAVHLISFGSNGTLADPVGLAAEIREAGVARCTVLVDWDDDALVPALSEAGLPVTHLLPVEFMANKVADWASVARAEGVVVEITDRPSPLVHETDIGAVAAVALTVTGWEDQTLVLTGPEALRPSEQVAILAEATGRPLRFEQRSPTEAAEHWRAAGVTEEMIAFKLELEAMDVGEFARVHDTVDRVLGRPATTFADWARSHADEFR